MEFMGNVIFVYPSMLVTQESRRYFQCESNSSVYIFTLQKTFKLTVCSVVLCRWFLHSNFVLVWSRFLPIYSPTLEKLSNRRHFENPSPVSPSPAPTPRVRTCLTLGLSINSIYSRIRIKLQNSLLIHRTIKYSVKSNDWDERYNSVVFFF